MTDKSPVLVALERGLPYRQELERLARAVLAEFNEYVDDVLQEVHVTAWEAVNRGEEIRDTRKYLRKLTRHKAADRKRNERRQFAAVLLSGQVARPAPENAGDLRARLADVTKALTLFEAEIARHVFAQGRTLAETAAIMRVPQARVQRVLDKVRGLLDGAGLAATGA
jgi:RNA polymerase sigma factor (sigma-70 family)